jgi:hypothetical protein
MILILSQKDLCAKKNTQTCGKTAGGGLTDEMKGDVQMYLTGTV